MVEQKKIRNEIQDDEIDLKAVFNKLWNEKWTIYIPIFVCFIFGFVISFTTPKRFNSETYLLIEANSNSNGLSGMLQQFGGLTGLPIGTTNSNDALTPELYPDIAKNIPFLLDILNHKVKESKSDSSLTVAQYFERHTRTSLLGKLKGLPGNVIGLFRMQNNLTSNTQSSDTLLKLSQKKFSLIKVLSSSINVQKGNSKMSNTLVVSTEVQDPIVAAQLNAIVVNCLKQYIIDYRTQKAKSELNFILARHAESEAKYIQAQQALAAFRDQNRNIILSSSRTQEERLQSEYNLAFNIFSTLSQQLEQAKIKVQENTPVFSILNPAIVPLQKSKPNITLTLVIMIFLGLSIGISFVFFKSYFYKI